MKPLLFGAVLALLWLAVGLPLATPFGGVANLVQPVTIAFVLGVLARPHMARWRWSR
ncbi:hypothetical protein ACFZCL_10395 [Streptomyces sp. NPDC008159]|uniref:hypothetical protein n=1 Tax=Streptomyces sp. NPDC008159 TaxID=3364817 RepID=UPI0036E394DF